MKSIIFNSIRPLENNKISQISENIQIKFKKILFIIHAYIFNIMKKIEFELIRNEGVYVKMTEEQKEIIKKLAKCQKQSTSDFIKWVIFSKYIDDFIK